MKSEGAASDGNTMRANLRGATGGAHDRLDRAMRPASDWRSRADYARFLKMQYAARVPVEHWLLLNASSDLEPPVQTPLIARDLCALGEALPMPGAPIELGDADEASVTGVAWVLAGSSLGNRAMLKDMQRARRGEETLPAHFLGDEAMLSFWKRLRPSIEQPTTRDNLDAAASAATRIFDHFLAVAAAQAPASAEPVLS